MILLPRSSVLAGLLALPLLSSILLARCTQGQVVHEITHESVEEEITHEIIDQEVEKPGKHLIVFREELALTGYLKRIDSSPLHLASGNHTQGHGHLHFGNGMYVLPQELTPDELAKAEEDPGVAYIEPDQRVSIYRKIVPKVIRQGNVPSWGLDRIDQRYPHLDHRYYFPASAGTGVTVYVVDTGVYTAHSDFQGRAHWGTNTAYNTNDADDNGHGTMVSGIIGGLMHGVAKNTTIIGVKALDELGQGDVSEILAALSWIFRDVKMRQDTRVIINLSIGSPFSKAFNDAVHSLYLAGILVISAAGNGDADGIPEDACTLSPSSSPYSMTVGALTEMDKPASFSNYGSCVNIWAPGHKIISAGINSPTAQAVKSGTSFSAPHVAGIAALVWAEGGPSMPMEDVWKAVIRGAIPNIITSMGIGESSSPNLMLYAGVGGNGALPMMINGADPSAKASLSMALLSTTIASTVIVLWKGHS